MSRSRQPSRLKTLSREIWPATSVAFLAVPQGLAYATIAGLPPVVGLYASMLPPVVGGILRSSRHVVTGPTNALSLLVGAAVLSTHDGDPVQVALALAVMVGIIQVVAGALRLGRVVGYVSASVVLGYITGAALLIGAGQLANLTGTESVRGTLWVMVRGWLDGLGGVSGVSVAVGAATLVIFAGVRV
ncbi:MAG: SulP family inorganic anion transporter, partial [Nannocystaceae bacterium]